MRERIFSLETEYGVVHRPSPHAAHAERHVIVGAIIAAVTGRLGAPHTSFLINGSRLYCDAGHAEWSLPECRSAREAVVYDRAADRALVRAIPEAERLLSNRGFRGHLSLIKNNVDPEGNTYGCHENYLAATTTRWLDATAHLRFSVRALLPFLATRQILSGTGRLGWGTRCEDGLRFQISQRADFISELVSAGTRAGRAIVSIGRESEPFATGDVRRLHLILGDANLSGWATWMKLGTTGLVLRMIEDLALGDIPHLVDPVAALHAVSRDPACRIVLALRDGTRRTATEVQRIYCEAAAGYVHACEASDEERKLIAEWAAALDALDRDPAELAGKADWVTKRALIERQLERDGTSWDDVASEPRRGFAAQRIDIQYHDLTPGTGLHARLLGRRADTLVEEAEIERAVRGAPAHTRARIRGDLVAARRAGSQVDITTWDAAWVGGAAIALPDPMQFFDGRVVPGLAAAQRDAAVAHVHDALAGATAVQVRLDAARALGDAPAYARVDSLRTAAAHDPDAAVRAAAAQALAATGAGPASATRRAQPAPPAGDGDLPGALQMTRHRHRHTGEASHAPTPAALLGELAAVPTSTVEPLLRIAVEGAFAVVRWRAIEALVRIGLPRDRVPLVVARLAGETDPEARLAVVRLIARAAARTSTPALMDALSDPDADVRIAAAAALATLGDRRALPALCAMAPGRRMLHWHAPASGDHAHEAAVAIVARDPRTLVSELRACAASAPELPRRILHGHEPIVVRGVLHTVPAGARLAVAWYDRTGATPVGELFAIATSTAPATAGTPAGIGFAIELCPAALPPPRGDGVLAVDIVERSGAHAYLGHLPLRRVASATVTVTIHHASDPGATSRAATDLVARSLRWLVVLVDVADAVPSLEVAAQVIAADARVAGERTTIAGVEGEATVPLVLDCERWSPGNYRVGVTAGLAESGARFRLVPRIRILAAVTCRALGHGDSPILVTRVFPCSATRICVVVDLADCPSGVHVSTRLRYVGDYQRKLAGARRITTSSGRLRLGFVFDCAAGWDVGAYEAEVVVHLTDSPDLRSEHSPHEMTCVAFVVFGPQAPALLLAA